MKNRQHKTQGPCSLRTRPKLRPYMGVNWSYIWKLHSCGVKEAAKHIKLKKEGLSVQSESGGLFRAFLWGQFCSACRGALGQVLLTFVVMLSLLGLVHHSSNLTSFYVIVRTPAASVAHCSSPALTCSAEDQFPLFLCVLYFSLSPDW